VCLNIQIHGGVMQQGILQLCKDFNIKGNLVNFKIFKSGHINTTLLVRFEHDGEIKEYVLQKINKYVFKNPEDVMHNISNVTKHIKNKIKANGQSPDRKVLNFLTSSNGCPYTVDDNGDYWRMYEFINKSITYDKTDDLSVLEQTGKAFGEFQQLLDDYPAENLKAIIPNFHNTINRYRIFKSVLNEDPVGRAEEVSQEIQEYVNLAKIATRICKMQAQGQLPLRVTHNDTKLNNVLIDNQTGEYLCVIDLDTIMPGMVCFDFGDAVRFAANTCDEDETDLSKVKLDFYKFEALAKGFLSRVGSSLTDNEKKTLSLGAITMTIECGLRFLTDYIDGDNYFKIDYPQHNLDRARCQLALAKDMINNYYLMQDIVNQYCNQYSYK